MEKKTIIGFTVGVFDMFHKGHLNILRRAKEQCDFLIVGVNTDELVEKYKNKRPVISLEDRMEIVAAIRYTDKVIPVNTLEKVTLWNQLHFNKIFIGDDHKNTPRWNAYEEEFKITQTDVDFVYLKRTEGVSSTILREKEHNKVE